MNACPTEETWRGVVLGPFAPLFLKPGAKPPESATFGVRSLEELERILAEFRQFLVQWINLHGAYTLEAQTLLQILNDRAHLQFKRWWLDAGSGRLFEELETKESTFRELLYSLLGLALKEASFREIHQCEACASFFYNSSGREVKFCSGACRNRTMVRRHRERTLEHGKAVRGGKRHHSAKVKGR